MIKVGSQVYIVPEDTRTKPYYAVVKSIGHKYITVEGRHISYSRFDVLTFESVCDRTGWNPRLKIYESKEAYEKIQAEQNEVALLKSKILMLLPDLSVEQLKYIYNYARTQS